MPCSAITTSTELYQLPLPLSSINSTELYLLFFFFFPNKLDLDLASSLISLFS